MSIFSTAMVIYLLLMRKGKDLHVILCVILSSDSITHQTLPDMRKDPRILQNADSIIALKASGCDCTNNNELLHKIGVLQRYAMQ